MNVDRSVQSFRSQVIALRHLPPGTPLPEPLRPEGRRLMAELLALPDAVDPSSWIEHHRSDLASRVLLWSVLDRVREQVRGLRYARRSGWPMPTPAQERRLGALLDLPDSTELFRDVERTHPYDASPTFLRDALAHLREIRGAVRHADAYGKGAGDWYSNIVEKLLSLPKEIDPLQWLGATESQRASLVTLARLLDEVRPAPPLLDGPAFKLKGRIARVRSADICAVVDELRVGYSGFSLSLDIRVCRRRIRPLPDVSVTRVEWGGFDYVMDDRQHYYLTRREGKGIEMGRFHWKEKMVLTCYPRLSAGVRHILAVSRPVLLEIAGYHRSDGLAYETVVPVGLAEWRLSLPADAW